MTFYKKIIALLVFISQISIAIPYTVNAYGDIFPKIDLVGDNELIQSLVELCEKFKQSDKAIIVSIPFDRSVIIKQLVSIGFSFFNGTSKEISFIIKNKANIPDPYTAVSYGDVVLLDNKNRVLIVEDNNNPGIMCFPGGSIDKNEYAISGALRELREEVGIEGKERDLELIGVGNRVNDNKCGANSYNYYYLLRKWSGEINTQRNEIKSFHWISLNQLVKERSINSLKVSPIVKEIALHIYGKCNTHVTKEILQNNRVMKLNLFKK